MEVDIGECPETHESDSLVYAQVKRLVSNNAEIQELTSEGFS